MIRIFHLFVFLCSTRNEIFRLSLIDCLKFLGRLWKTCWMSIRNWNKTWRKLLNYQTVEMWKCTDVKQKATRIQEACEITKLRHSALKKRRGKRLSYLLKSIFPRTHRVSVLWFPRFRGEKENYFSSQHESKTNSCESGDKKMKVKTLIYSQLSFSSQNTFCIKR